METLMRAFIGIVVALLLNLAVVEAKPTFEKNRGDQDSASGF